VFASQVKLEGDVKIVGMCPECGNPVIETEKAFGCSNWKNGCKFTVWKNDKFIESLGKKVSPEMVELLLKNGRVGFRGLLSRKGTKFDAYLHYVKEDGKDFYSWKFEFI
jgi:DNA topoisomerase-3